MAIDFSFPEEVTHVVAKVRDFCEQVVAPSTREIEANEGNREILVAEILEMRRAAQEWELSGCRICPRSTGAWGSATSRWRRSPPRRPGAAASVPSH